MPACHHLYLLPIHPHLCFPALLSGRIFVPVMFFQLLHLLLYWWLPGQQHKYQKQMYFLRAGSHLNHDTAGLSLGAGANIRLGRMMLTIDYAYVDYDILNSTNQFAISLKF